MPLWHFRPHSHQWLNPVYIHSWYLSSWKEHSDVTLDFVEIEILLFIATTPQLSQTGSGLHWWNALSTILHLQNALYTWRIFSFGSLQKQLSSSYICRQLLSIVPPPLFLLNDMNNLDLQNFKITSDAAQRTNILGSLPMITKTLETLVITQRVFNIMINVRCFHPKVSLYSTQNYFLSGGEDWRRGGDQVSLYAWAWWDYLHRKKSSGARQHVKVFTLRCFTMQGSARTRLKKRWWLGFIVFLGTWGDYLQSEVIWSI